GPRLRRAGGEQSGRRERAVAVRPDAGVGTAEPAVPRTGRGGGAEVGRGPREGRAGLSRLQAGRDVEDRARDGPAGEGDDVPSQGGQERGNAILGGDGGRLGAAGTAVVAGVVRQELSGVLRGGVASVTRRRWPRGGDPRRAGGRPRRGGPRAAPH